MPGQKLFQTLPLAPPLLQAVRELGYTHLTPIQAQSIPVLLEGKDLVGQSKTGSGKTAAFSLPILQKIQLKKRRLQALILCPTRELCTQVAREARKLGRHFPGLNVLILSGGLPIFSQVNALEKGAHIAIGTPGRVLDHLRRGTLDLSEIATFVLDEADRMLDMGFQEDMELIVRELPERRQTVLFSATFPRSIESMSRAIQHEPVRVTIEDEGLPQADIRQLIHEVDRDAKFDALLALLRQHQPESAMVFCNLKVTVADLARALAEAGGSVAALHGDLEQADRDRVMAKFRNQSVRVLVATDVAARGIDIENLDLVVNFDLSPDPEVYVHRIGRTGRAGRKGLAISFATAQDPGKIGRIEEYLGRKLERAPLELPPSDAPAAPELDQQAKMTTLFIGGGRKDKMRPGDILGALTGEAGFSASDIGKIEIHDRFSYVAVSKTIAKAAMKRLGDGRIKGRKFRVGLAH